MSYCGDSPLWNETLLSNSSWPQFTACFQSTVLVFIPNGFLWGTMIIYLPWLFTQPLGLARHNTWTSVTKTTLSIVLALCAIIAIFMDSGFGRRDMPYPTAHYVARIIEGITYMLSAILSQLERSRGLITSGVLLMYWLLLAVTDIVPLYTYILLNWTSKDLGRVLIFLVSYALVLAQLVLQAAFVDLPRQGYTPGACPETTATFLSRITFCWMSRLIFSGFRKPLEAADLWQLNPREASATVVPQLERNLEKAGAFTGYRKSVQTFNNQQYCSQNNNSNGEESPTPVGESDPLLSSCRRHSTYNSDSKKNSKPENERPEPATLHFSLLRVMIRTYYNDVLLSYVCKLCSDVLQYLSPMLLGLLITHIQSVNDKYWKGFAIAVIMLTASWSQTLFYHQHFHKAMTAGMHMKTSLMAAIYKKSLRLNPESQRTGTVGEVVNMMSVDCQRVQGVMSFTWMFWSIPFQVILAVYLLWDTLGPSVLAGVVCLLLLVPVNGYLAFRQHALQKENLQWKDKRLKIMNEIISGIKVLKMYAWETSFQEKVMALRKKEINVLTKVAHINAINIFIWTCVPYLVTLAAFATYVLTDASACLDANKAFVTLSLFNILQYPVSFVPEMVTFTVQAWVSIKRIEKFLKLGELDPCNVTNSGVTECAVQIDRGLFTWDRRGRSTLHGINLEVSDGELVAVIGNVGSGKSSLISAILGEMERRQGEVSVRGHIAYVPQQAWIQNASLRDNILFGKHYHERRYKKVVEACALTLDVDMLPGGDQTEIGEKGINLSGGQKHRVSLARAVYANADIYLLDDPLSAVDSHVGRHIFRKVIGDKGILKHKTRILVTHAVHWLPLVDTIVLLHEGRVVETGSYLQLMRRNGPLCQYLHAVLSNSDDTDNEDDQDVRELRQRIFEHVQSCTSTSEGGLSGDSMALYQESNKFLSSFKSQQNASGLAQTDVPDVPKPVGAYLTEEEQAATGRVKLKVFTSYLRHIGFVMCILILLFFILYELCSVCADFWLATWTDDPVFRAGNSTILELENRNHFFLTYYGLFGVGQAFFIFLYAWLAAVRMTHAATSMHVAILDCVLRSPMSFFDTTPSGRIINRFSRDIEAVDNTLPQIIFMFIPCVFSVLSTLVVISVATPIFVVVILPLVLSYYILQRFFVPTSRQLNRLEAITRSPVCSHFSETLSGASVIRAYQVAERFISESMERIDKNQLFYFAGITANRWLGVWIEVLSSCVVFASTIFALISPEISGSKAGLSITYALQITQALKWLVRTISDLEANVVTVERLQEYSELTPEAPAVTLVRPCMTWPSHGNVVFSNYSMRYRPGLDLAVKNININIRGGEKIGIVGRTGAGKSSLTLSLFRLVEPAAGTIIIDGIDTTSLGLHDLRSRLTILPQEPLLFSGSLRMNLDPFAHFTDRELWDALQLAHLFAFVRELPDRLEHDCGEGGRNLSVGQRQLVCLARGLLRRTRILVLDEPTAAVDLETDILIQGTIRRDFAEATTITIAHRLNTIMDYDRVLVLEEGQVKEFDNPSVLLQNKESLFYALAQDAGLISS